MTQTAGARRAAPQLRSPGAAAVKPRFGRLEGPVRSGCRTRRADAPSVPRQSTRPPRRATDGAGPRAPASPRETAAGRGPASRQPELRALTGSAARIPRAAPSRAQLSPAQPASARRPSAPQPPPATAKLAAAAATRRAAKRHHSPSPHRPRLASASGPRAAAATASLR